MGDASSDDLYYAAWSSERVAAHPRTAARLDAFNAQYGFARNVAFTCLLLGPILLIYSQWDQRPHMAYYGAVAVLAGVVLFYRFLKFYRHYSVEVLNRFGALPDADARALH
jgi:hypothetical protein